MMHRKIIRSRRVGADPEDILVIAEDAGLVRVRAFQRMGVHLTPGEARQAGHAMLAIADEAERQMRELP